MIHVCVRRFDVTDVVGNFLGTKHGLSVHFISKAYYVSVQCICKEHFPLLTLVSLHSRCEVQHVLGCSQTIYRRPRRIQG